MPNNPKRGTQDEYTRRCRDLPALNVRISIALDAQGVFADGRPPDVLDGAGALAVDALDLVGADDGVLEGGAVLELEDGVGVAALGLPRALDAAAVRLHAAVEGLVGGDRLHLAVRYAALGGRDGEGGTLVERGGRGEDAGGRAEEGEG